MEACTASEDGGKTSILAESVAECVLSNLGALSQSLPQEPFEMEIIITQLRSRILRDTG